MSTQYRPTIVGLVSPGLFWLAASVAQGQSSPRPQGLPPISAPASPSTFSVLLMSNGTVVRGEIVDDPAGGVYRLKTRGGQVPYPKSSVKRAGQSIDELYRYQVAALPPGDPEERMKLVRWCLTEHLPALAREQLVDVLKLCPDDAEANRMAANLDANTPAGNRDPDVRQTSGEMPRGDAPATLDPGIVKKVRKGFGNSLPEIFDLPPAQAVRRASEFAEYVQPVLQQSCASCHNEKYQGDFQLVQVRNKKDLRNPDIVRANLDAALRLVNPDDPARSDLLSACLVPHGPNKGAIFRGPNDGEYRKVVTWVRSLRPKANIANGKGFGGTNDKVSQTGYTPAGSPDGFASDRQGRAGASFSTGVDVSGNKLTTFTPPGGSRVVNEINESADFSGGTVNDFPVPFSVGGKEFDKPTPTNPGPTPKRRSTPSTALPTLPNGQSAKPGASLPRDDDESASRPAADPTTDLPIGPKTVVVDLDDDRNNLPGMKDAKYPNLKPKVETDPVLVDEEPKPAPTAPPSGATPAKKKPKVDPALLEKMIKQRSTPNP